MTSSLRRAASDAPAIRAYQAFALSRLAPTEVLEAAAVAPAGTAGTALPGRSVVSSAGSPSPSTRSG